MNNESLPAPAALRAAPATPAARISDRLTQAIDKAAAGPRDSNGRLVRSDGWTPDAIRIFLDVLAECGTVRDAARAAGMSRSSAYAFCRRKEGQDFADAWDGALLHARRHLAGEMMSRAVHGCVEVIMRDGQVWGERHRYDNRHSMAMLTRLDQKALASDAESERARLVAGAFDEYVDLVCAGEDTDEFFESRAEEEADRDGAPPFHMDVHFIKAKPQSAEPE
jgi:hypothetical protein